MIPSAPGERKQWYEVSRFFGISSGKRADVQRISERCAAVRENLREHLQSNRQEWIRREAANIALRGEYNINYLPKGATRIIADEAALNVDIRAQRRVAHTYQIERSMIRELTRDESRGRG